MIALGMWGLLLGIKRRAERFASTPPIALYPVGEIN